MTKNGALNSKNLSPSLIDCSGIEFLGDRDGQEDYFLAEVKPSGKEVVAILADGMGGHASGEVASQKAVEVFNKTYKEYPSESVSTKLGAALQQANNELANSIANDSSLDGMGCTLVGLHVGNEGLRWISVGDSPLFLYRNNNLLQINADHSMAPIIEESFKQGKITKEEAANHPSRNALRSAVMGGELTLIDTPTTPYGLVSGDILILASDGIMSLSKTEIESILKTTQKNSSSQICTALINAVKAKKRPRQDNTTAIVIKIPTSMGSSGAVSKSLRILALASVLGFLGAFGFYVNQTFNLKIFFSELDKKPATVTEVPKPLAAPGSSEIKEPDSAKPEANLPASKSTQLEAAEKKKSNVSEDAKNSTKHPDASKKSVPKQNPVIVNKSSVAKEAPPDSAEVAPTSPNKDPESSKKGGNSTGANANKQNEPVVIELSVPSPSNPLGMSPILRQTAPQETAPTPSQGELRKNSSPTVTDKSTLYPDSSTK